MTGTTTPLKQLDKGSLREVLKFHERRFILGVWVKREWREGAWQAITSQERARSQSTQRVETLARVLPSRTFWTRSCPAPFVLARYQVLFTAATHTQTRRPCSMTREFPNSVIMKPRNVLSVHRAAISDYARFLTSRPTAALPCSGRIKASTSGACTILPRAYCL